MIRLPRRRALPAAVVCFALAALTPSASGKTMAHPKGGKTPSKTNATVACKPPSNGEIRCTMTLKQGAGISGKVTMRITRGKLLVATGNGTITQGKATLTMRVLHKMTRGSYTVSMVVTLNATKVLRLG